MADFSDSPFDLFLVLLNFLKQIASFVSVYFPNISGGRDYDDDDRRWGRRGTYGF